MKDSMSLLSGVAASYQTMPLSMLHQLQSVLTVEITNRLESFGEYSSGKSEANSGDNIQDSVVGSVAEVVSKNVAGCVGNNVVIGNFSRGKQ